MTKTGRVLVGGLIALSLAACAGRRCDVLKDPYVSEQSKIQKTLHEIFESAKAKNIDQLEKFHAYGPKFTKFDDWEPLDRQDAETGKKAEREGFSAITKFSYDIKDLKIDVFGPTAVATFVLMYDMEMGKDKATAKARSTLVFVRDGSEWKITHEHFSPFKSNP